MLDRDGVWAGGGEGDLSLNARAALMLSLARRVGSLT